MSYKKYYVSKKQYSTDSGQTWIDVYPLETTPSGDPIGSYSTMNECEASRAKYKFNYTNNRTASAVCDSSASITRNIVRGTGIPVTAMTSAEIGECVETIDSIAFGYQGFDDQPPKPGVLTSVTLSNSVKYIKDWAFRWCFALRDINLENSSVEEIGDAAFSQCGMTNITLPNSLKYLGVLAFEFSSLTSVTINGDDLIIGTSGASEVFVGGIIKRINSSVDGVCNIPSCVKGISGWPLFGNGESQGYTNYNITTINIESGVRNIGFNDVGVSAENPFCNLPNLSAITVDSNNIAYDSRNNCNAIIRSIDSALISGCKNTIIPNGVTSIGGRAFQCCTGLTSIVVPNSVTEIGGEAFEGCGNLTSINIPSNVTSIGGSAFRGTSITNVTIPNGVTKIEFETFYGCTNLSNVSLPNGITEIGRGAFERCSSLTTLTLGSEITQLWYDALARTSLSDLIVYATTPPGLHPAFYPALPSGCVVHVPAESVEIYQSTSPWSNYTITAI